MTVYPIFQVWDCGAGEEMVAIMDTEEGARQLVDELGGFGPGDFDGFLYSVQNVTSSPAKVKELLKDLGRI